MPPITWVHVAAIAAAVLVLAIITFLVGRALWRCWKRWIRHLGKWRRAVAAWFAKWSRVLPYSHSMQKAVIYTIVVMIVSLAAPQLSEWIGTVLSWVLKDACATLRNCLTISVVAGSSTAITFVFLREKPVSFASRVLERLSGTAGPDGGETPERVTFVTYPEIPSPDEHKREFLNIEEARKGVQEWLIVLQQATKGRRKYTIEYIEEQLKVLRSKIDAENVRRTKKKRCNSKDLPDSEKLKVKWVCFVSSTGRFHAFQPYTTFCFHILIKHNSRYVAILNTATEKGFADAIQAEIDLSQKFKIKDGTDTEREAFIPDAIPDLDRVWIRKGLSHDRVLDILIKEGKTRAMLVTGLCHFNPLGVITATELAKRVLFEPLIKTSCYTSPIEDADKGELHGDGPPGLAQTA